MARCGCGSECGCNLVAGDNIQVSGSGTDAVPWVVSAQTDCAEVRQCITADNGATFNQGTGVIGVCVSPNVGNGLVHDANGCLYVGAGAATVTTGCGLTGNGAPATPVTANTGVWPYVCNRETNAGLVVCDSNGQLRGEPRGKAGMSTFFFDQDFANVVFPAATNQFILRVQSNFTNPDPCRTSIMIAMQELEFAVNLPVNAGAEYGFDGPDETVFHINRGTSAENGFHIQSTKIVNRGTIAPGATVSVGFDVLAGRGTNGANYSHIQGILRVLMITQ